MDLTKRELLNCPFCNANKEHFDLVELDRVNKQLFDKAGKCRRRVKISHRVECTCCGANGPFTYFVDLEDKAELVEDDVLRSEEAAITSWNARGALRDKAFAAVNEIFEKSLKSC